MPLTIIRREAPQSSKIAQHDVGSCFFLSGKSEDENPKMGTYFHAIFYKNYKNRVKN